MRSSRDVRVMAVVLLASASRSVAQSSSTTSAGVTMMTSSSTLKLAASYTGNDFFNRFNYFTDADPSGGYVNYVGMSTAQSEGLASVMSDGSFLMRANAETTATGRGRDSVRITSKDEYGDAVYILDLNHLPVGCGTWPAFWTVVENGWPSGGEIDIIEGANALPSPYSTAWNATGNLTNNISPTSPLRRDTASLHLSTNCQLNSGAYMTGTMGSTVCDAYLNNNEGCGVELGGNTTYGVDSFGAGVNTGGGGWYAMWRDVQNSGGVYIYYWPRNSSSVPADVKDGTTTTTNVEAWGPPGANLSVPSCKSDFGNHVIVFNIDFCGDYVTSTYAQSGCPSTTSCSAFVQSNPAAFSEAYWSINSLRVYTASGKPVSSGGLSAGAIAGIVVGAVVFLAICGLIFWRYRVTRRRRALLAAGAGAGVGEDEDGSKPYTGWVGADSVSVPEGYVGPMLSDVASGSNTQLTPNKSKSKSKSKSKRSKHGTDHDGKVIATLKPRTGKTKLAPGRTAHHTLPGETSTGFYHDQYDQYEQYDQVNLSAESLALPSRSMTPIGTMPNTSSVALQPVSSEWSSPSHGKLAERKNSIPWGRQHVASPPALNLALRPESPGGRSRRSSRAEPTTPRSKKGRERQGSTTSYQSSPRSVVGRTDGGGSQANSVYSGRKFSAATTEYARRGSTFQGAGTGNSWVG